MTEMNENQQTEFFADLVYLADSLVSDFDVVELVTHLVEACQRLLPIASAGIMLNDQAGRLQVLASSTEDGRLLELLELQSNEGPCLDAFRTGQVVEEPDLSTTDRWPPFTAGALQQGLRAAYAVPMRLRTTTIGALNIFCLAPTNLRERELDLAQVMADIATIGILSSRNLRDQEILSEQLQTALNSKVAIEQAKGVLAERLNCSTAAAFDALRSAARNSGRPLAEVALDVVAGRTRLQSRAESLRSEFSQHRPPP